MIADEQLLKICLECGARDARIVDAAQIPFDAKLRSYCEANACGSYKRNYACPPFVGEPEALIAKAQSRHKALLFQTVAELEDSFDLEGMDAAAKAHGRTCRAIYKALSTELGDMIFLTAGGCNICPECAAKTGEPCRCPEMAFASLEAWCINVSRLCGKCGMKYINGPDTVTYFGMCLFD